MDESIYFSLNKSDICRICGENNALKTFLIYEKSGASELTIADLINRYLPVQVSNNDEYPKTICYNCKTQLDMYIKFVDTLLSGQLYLRQVYKASKQISPEKNIPYVNEKTSSLKSNISTDIDDEDIVFETVKLLAVENDIKYHPINNLGAKLPSNSDVINEKNGNATTNVAQRFSCEYCLKTFAQKTGLNIHLKIHKGIKTHVCKVCNKSYYQSGNLLEHMRIHTGEKPFKCDYCSIAFRTSCQLKTHIRSHNGDRPYECSVCKRLFKHNNSLKCHLRRHYNDRPFICEFCPKSFFDRTALVRHSRTHTGEKPYLCDICNKEFSTNSNFKKHRKTHTNDQNSTLWKLTSKFQKNASEIDYTSTSLINNNDLNIDDLFLISNEVKNLNVDLPSSSDNVDDLLNLNTSVASLSSISFSESILELNDNNLS